MHQPEAETKFLRLKWRRAFDRWRGKATVLVIAAKGGFNPNQPRVPAGKPDGGQWTGGGSGSGSGTRRRRDSDEGQVLSDANPDNLQRPGAEIAQAGRRRPGSRRIRINGRWHTPTRAQEIRLATANGRARRALKKVQKRDPNWKPRPSLEETIEGRILRLEGEARQAESRLSELLDHGIGPGRYAVDSIPAHGPGRITRVDDIRQNNRNGEKHGCHVCGGHIPKTLRGNYILDHQPPTAWNPLGRLQRIYPQCTTCSSRQGGWIRKNGGRR